jgi:hypothetical protein
MTKNMILSALLAGAFFVFSAQAGQSQILNCEGGLGGPAEASATLEVQVDEDGLYLLKLHLENAAIPDGLEGIFVGEINQASQTMSVLGDLGDKRANLFLDFLEDSISLAVYAARDRQIEFGFGAHFICR